MGLGSRIYQKFTRTVAGLVPAPGSAGTLRKILFDSQLWDVLAATDVPFYQTTSISSNTNAANGATYLCDTSSGSFTVTLPAPAINTWVEIKDSTGSFHTNPLTVARNGTEKIEGLAASKVLSAEWGLYIFASNGTDWFQVGPKNRAWKAYTSSGTWTPPAGVNIIYNLVLRFGSGGGGGGGAGGAGFSGGGAGGGAGGGGGCGAAAGASILPFYAVTPGTACTVTVGAGGAAGTGAVYGGAAATAGANGGGSLFDRVHCGQNTFNQAGFAGGNGGNGGATTIGSAGAAALANVYNVGPTVCNNNFTNTYAGGTGGLAGANGTANTVFPSGNVCSNYTYAIDASTRLTSNQYGPLAVGTGITGAGGGGGGGLGQLAPTATIYLPGETSGGNIFISSSANGGNAGATTGTAGGNAVTAGLTGTGGDGGCGGNGGGGGGSGKTVAGGGGGNGSNGGAGSPGYVGFSWWE